MSEYSDYIVDFPGRCLDILKYYEPDATIRKLDVTLMLMAATSAFVVPIGRLDSSHPAEDFRQLKEHITEYNRELGKKWVKSSLSKGTGEWLYGFVDEFGGGPDVWHSELKKIDDKDVNQILIIIRNALAHGNIYTKGDPIKTLVFYSEKRGEFLQNCLRSIIGYRYLYIPASGFSQFLSNWFDLLNSTHANYRTILEDLTMNTAKLEMADDHE